MKNKIISFINHYFLYFIGIFTLFMLKLFYSRADADGLIFMLAPVTWLVNIISGIPFYRESHVGYVSHTLQFIIAPSCSGFQFMMIAFATLYFSVLHTANSENALNFSFVQKKRGFFFLIVSLLVSYLFTIPVNAVRILLSLYLPAIIVRLPRLAALLTQDTLHTLIGTVTYFTALLFFYSASAKVTACFFTTKVPVVRRTATAFSPLFWYLVVVLGIPFLTRTLQGNYSGFFSYAVLILAVCLIIFTLKTILTAISRHSKLL